MKSILNCPGASRGEFDALVNNEIDKMTNQHEYFMRTYRAKAKPLARFNLVSDWTKGTYGTVALDTTVKKYSDTNIRLTASASTDAVQMDFTCSVYLGDTNRELRFLLYLHAAPEKYSDMWIYIASNAWSKYLTINLRNFSLVQGWNYIRLAPSSGWTNVGSSTWDDTFIKVRLKFTPADSSAPAVTYERFEGGVVDEPRIVFTFDDGYQNNIDNAYPIMAANGFNGTIYVNPNTIGAGDKMSVAQLKTLYNAGWDIASHGYAHIHYNSSSAAQILADVQDATTWLLANGFSRSAYHFGVPYGEDNADMQTALNTVGILTSRNSVYASFWPPSYDLHSLPSQPIKNTSTISTACNLVDSAINLGKTVIFMFHQIVEVESDEYHWSIDKFTELCKYLYNRGVPVIPISQWYRGL